jgi:hypothetical protein
VIPPRPPTTVNTRQQRRYPTPRRIRQLTTTHHKINYQTAPSAVTGKVRRVGGSLLLGGSGEVTAAEVGGCEVGRVERVALEPHLTGRSVQLL